MNKYTRTIFTTLLVIWLIPQMGIAVAADPSMAGLCVSKIGKIKDTPLPDTQLCLTEAEEKTMVYAVLEEGLDTPDTEANEGNSMVRPCARYTEILQCTPSGDKKTKQINQELLKTCPDDLPDSGTDKHGQYFDCQEVSVIIVDPETGGIGLLQVYIGLIYRWAAGIVGVIAVLIIIVSGIQISTANGEPSVVEEARKRIVQSLGGIAILFLASGLLYVINPTFFKAPDYVAQEKIAEKNAEKAKIDAMNKENTEWNIKQKAAQEQYTKDAKSQAAKAKEEADAADAAQEKAVQDKLMKEGKYFPPAAF